MIDDAYGAQMALRQELITTKRDQVIAIDPAAMPRCTGTIGAGGGLFHAHGCDAACGWYGANP